MGPTDAGNNSQHLLVFGASGAIGGAIASAASARGWRVTRVGRRAGDGVEVVFDPEQMQGDALAAAGKYSSVCWAQGANLNDSVYDVDLSRHRELYEANVEFILITLSLLLREKLLAPGSKLCVISSIWQNLARQNKLSYCVTKAALQGLVLSAATDLARDGHLINAILPGALETPMTRQNLRSEQIDALSNATGFNRLATLDDVAGLACFLCSKENTGITGQFIAADLGFSHVRIV